MSPEVHALEQRLRENPDDELCWQVYADALLAQGDARGELIALSLRDEAPDSVLGARTEQLRMLQFVGLGPASSSWDLEWRHGFVISAHDEVLYPYEIEELGELLAKPQFRLLSRLHLEFDHEGGEDLSLLEGLEHMGTRGDTIRPLAALDLRTLAHLNLAYSVAGDDLAEVLAKLDLSGLRELDLRYCGFTDVGVRALAGNQSLGALRTLHLQANRFETAGIEALATAPALAQLEHLDLRGTRCGPLAARMLADAPFAGTLELLHLDREDIEPEGVAALASSTQLRPELARLWRARGASRAR